MTRPVGSVHTNPVRKARHLARGEELVWCFRFADIYRTEMSDQLIPHDCGLDGVVVNCVNLQEELQAPPRQMATLRFQEGSDSESQYSTGTNSPDDQRSLSGTESPYEGSQCEELVEFQFTPILPLGLPHISSEPSNSLLANIPTELHLLIFSHLDPLDSACLGLTNAHFYNLQKALYGTIPLSTSRKGRAWELHRKRDCRHCGTYGCQLHVHLRDWVPQKYEYCAIRQVYGLRAREGAKKEFCYRSNPLKPGRCGRHAVKEVRFED